MSHETGAFLTEPARRTPIVWEGDLCVVGGSCTGVFAAVRAARLGLRVAVVEWNSLFGGMAVAAQVHHWHRLMDSSESFPVIGGLTREMVDRLMERGAAVEVPPGKRVHYKFNSAELAVELDRLVVQEGVRPFLRAQAVAAVREEQRVTAVVIEDKSGRRALRAKMFIDASGDGDLLAAAGFPRRKPEALQPANLQALVDGLASVGGKRLKEMIAEKGPRFGYPTENSVPWIDLWPGASGVRNVYGPRLNQVDASDADSLTRTLIEARAQHRALCDMVAETFGEMPHLVAWPHALGVRETYHAECLHQLTAAELLSGYPFEDRILNGTYPVDVHSPDGTVLRYLDGTESVRQPDNQITFSRWRDEQSPTPACYHAPYRSLVPRDSQNLLVAGRLIDADREAFGGVRVMVNCNQMGEAAGVAAALALREQCAVSEVDPAELRATLEAGGSIVV